MNKNGKRPRATLEQKIIVLDYLHGPPRRSQQETYLKFSNDSTFTFSTQTLSNWVLNERQLRTEFNNGGKTLQYKKKPVLKYPELTLAVENDIKTNYHNGDLLSDKCLKEIFSKYVEKLGIKEFKFSTGMLHSFKKRNGIFKGRYVRSETTTPLDFNLDDIFSNSDIGFSTKLIHSDDNLLPFLNLVNDPALFTSNADLTAQQFDQLSNNEHNVQIDHRQSQLQQQQNIIDSSLNMNANPNNKKHDLTTYSTYSNPFHSNAYYKRRPETLKKNSNPNSEKIEKILETITEGNVTLYNSGTSAIMGVLSYINPRMVFIDDDGYIGTHKVIDLLSKLTGLKKYSLSYLHTLSSDLLNDSVIILESPQNPLGYVYDLAQYYEISKLNDSCRLLVDSTLAPPPLQFPFKYGADFIVYSAVKYLAGVSDLSAGFVVSRTNKSKLELHSERSALGTSIASFDSFLLLRSLRTYRMRITTQCQNTEKLIKFLTKNSYKYKNVVVSIRHSSLQPNADVIMKQLNNYYNPVFAIELKEEWMLKGVLSAFTFLSNNPNLEGGETLVEMVQGNPNFFSSVLPNNNHIRFSVGCEDFQDIIRDVDQALVSVANKCAL